MVHVRNHHPVYRHPHHSDFSQVTAQLDRFRGHAQLLLRYATSAFFQGSIIFWGRMVIESGASEGYIFIVTNH